VLQSTTIALPSETPLQGVPEGIVPREAAAASTGRAPSPQREAWPNTGEWRALRQREREPVARHNKTRSERQIKRMQAEKSTVSGQGSTLSASSSAGLRRTKPEASLTVHNPKQRDAMLQPDKKRLTDR